MVCVAALSGCGTGSTSPATSAIPDHRELERYVSQVEPIRLGVNRLLDGADPILKAFKTRHISDAAAAAHMAALEWRFAAFTVEIAAIQPPSDPLRSLHAGYAETYVLEDAYLSALVSGLASRTLEHLPNTQSAQRAAIIRWRTGLTVLALKARVPRPADLQQAGRGEIAPSPGGS